MIALLILCWLGFAAGTWVLLVGRTPTLAEDLSTLGGAVRPTGWHALVENDNAIVLIEIHFIIPAIRKFGQESGCERANFRPHRGIEVGAQVEERAIELVVQPQLDLALGDGTLARRSFRGTPLGVAHRSLSRHQLAARLGDAELGRAQRMRRPVVALASRRELRLRESLRCDRIAQLPHLLLPCRQGLLGQLSFANQRFRTIRPCLQCCSG